MWDCGVHRKGIVRHVVGAREAGAVVTVTDEEVLPYRLQGSAHFDNDEAILAARNVLRGSQRLRSAILQFWTSAGLRQWDKMSEETYAHVHLRIAKALAPEPLSPYSASDFCAPPIMRCAARRLPMIELSLSVSSNLCTVRT